ncbi:hypothetical protein DL771_011670 [Monosporascus sp. 5C6A]|nr:hypothetical protein DL771_011670 [Monosporascus sp. 5C6A]
MGALWHTAWPCSNASPVMSGLDTLPLILAATAAVVSAAIAVVGSCLLYMLDIGTPTGNWIGYQIVGALGWGAGFQIPIIICQAFAKPKNIPSVTAIILFFLNVGGGLLINAAQSAFVNRLMATLPTSAPGVDPALVLVTGATEIRSVFPEDQIPGIAIAYMAGIKLTLALAIAACGISFIVSFLGGWRRLNLEAAKSAGIAA